MLFFKKKPDPSQPHPDWPWTLSEGGNILREFTWENIEHDLAELYPDNDSFLILEQKDPKDDKRYWFIQSAMNRAGPKPGWYTVEVGWGGGQGKGLLDLDVRTVEEAIPFFRTAYGRKPLELSQFEDQSDMLG